MQSWPWRVLKKVAQYGLTYAVLQVVTGIEVGFAAVAFYFLADMSLPAALSAAFPLGLPLLVLQGAAAVAYHEGLVGKMMRARARAVRQVPDVGVARMAG